VRSLIDSFPFPASTIAKEDLETPGQLSLQLGHHLQTGKEYDAAIEETDLQRLLKNKSEFVFENLGAKVKITSEIGLPPEAKSRKP
jgi:hypothetical protein